ARLRARAARGAWPSSPAAPDDGPPELISDYGATDPAEFFAVVTEVFYEQPAALAVRHPALFEVLRGYYRVDPREWH
ncbi:MAG TPA: zinc-dependent peptidase, partial [Burkholderiaceae bacterium]